MLHLPNTYLFGAKLWWKNLAPIGREQIRQTLDFHQPREQARFRAGFSMIDHLHVINQFQEKAHENNIPLCFAFVNYERAFDSIEFEPIFHALKNHGVDKAYLDIIKHL